MKVKELIEVLKTIDPEMLVCGQSETGTWEIEPEDVVPVENEHLPPFRPTVPKILILGYRH